MLTGKTAVVTGASRGIGAATAKKLASLGADAALIYAGNEALAEAVAEECRAFGGKALPYRCDVSDFEAVKETVARIRKDFGGVQILVNNAGVTRDGLAAAMKEEDFDAVLDVNLKGAFHMIRQCCGLMLRAKWGRIVNISSVAGLMGNAGQANYAASKAGLVGMAKSLAKEVARRGITVNCISPGFIDTDFIGNLTAEQRSSYAASVPMRRFGTTDEIAAAALYLASKEAGYTTGAVLEVSGGL